MFKKNDIIKISISDIGAGGEGIGKADGFTFFVNHAIPKDTVEAVVTKVKKNYGYAKVLSVIEASPDRVEPPCENAVRCGGCQLMEMSYERQLKYKEDKIIENLRRIGGIELPPGTVPSGMPLVPLGTVPGGTSPLLEERVSAQLTGGVSPLRYRNKLQFPIGRGKDGKIIAGFYAGRTHSIIDTEDCMAAPELNAQILSIVKLFIEENNLSVYDEKTGEGLVRHLMIRTGFRTGEVMVCLVINGDRLKDKKTEEAFVQALLKASLIGPSGTVPLGISPLDVAEGTVPGATSPLLEERVSAQLTGEVSPAIKSICININKANTNVIMGKECRTLYGKDHITDELCVAGRKLKFKISTLSFYQVNPAQAEKLYEKAFEFADLKGDETVWDLYCGIGTISLFAAERAGKVTGVEYVSAAIEDAKENAALNGIENAEFICGKAEEIFPESASSADVVILDPPRKGCDEKLLSALKKVGPEKIVYISCDSATLARDLKILAQEDGASYKVEKLSWADMFPNSVHVETVCLLSNRKPDTKVRIDVDLEDYYRIKDSKKNQD